MAHERHTGPALDEMLTIGDDGPSATLHDVEALFRTSAVTVTGVVLAYEAKSLHATTRSDDPHAGAST